MISGAINVQDLLGKDVGAAYVYRHNSIGDWVEETRLMPSDGEHNDAFGWAVGIDGSAAIVGTPFHDAVGFFSGAAYLFAKDKDLGWSQTAKFIPPDGRSWDRFGESVAISGHVAVVGAPVHEDSPAPGTFLSKGAVYVYEELPDIGWRFSAKLQGNDTVYGDEIGYRVAADGDTIAATALSVKNLDANWLGTTYLFRKSADHWSQIARLQVDDPLAGGTFGMSVALDDGRLLVGSLATPGSNLRGGAYVYEEDASGGWIQTAKLVPHDIDQRWFFGIEVDLAGNLAAITAYSSPDGAVGGVVYVFERNEAGNWREIATLTSSKALNSFGFSVATNGREVFVGSGVNLPGSVHVFSQVPEPSAMAIWMATVVLTLACGIRGARRSCLGCRNSTIWRLWVVNSAQSSGF